MSHVFTLCLYMFSCIWIILMSGAVSELSFSLHNFHRNQRFLQITSAFLQILLSSPGSRWTRPFVWHRPCTSRLAAPDSARRRRLGDVSEKSLPSLGQASSQKPTRSSSNFPIYFIFSKIWDLQWNVFFNENLFQNVSKDSCLETAWNLHVPDCDLRRLKEKVHNFQWNTKRESSNGASNNFLIQYSF